MMNIRTFLDGLQVWNVVLRFNEEQLRVLKESSYATHTVPVNNVHVPHINPMDKDGQWALCRLSLCNCYFSCRGFFCLKGRTLLSHHLIADMDPNLFACPRKAVISIKATAAGELLVSTVRQTVLFDPFTTFNNGDRPFPLDLQFHRLIPVDRTQGVPEVILDISIAMFDNNAHPTEDVIEFAVLQTPSPSMPVTLLENAYMEREVFGDVSIRLIGLEDEILYEIKAHSLILSLASPILSRALRIYTEGSLETREKSKTTYKLEIHDDVSSRSIDLLLCLIYKGTLQRDVVAALGDDQFIAIFHLTMLVHMYQLPESVFDSCRRALIYYARFETRLVWPHLSMVLNIIRRLDNDSRMAFSKPFYLSLLLLYKISPTEGIDEDVESDISSLDSRTCAAHANAITECATCHELHVKLLQSSITDLSL